jgi:hypothetical protein
MKSRTAFLAATGFLVACCWVLYTFVATPEQVMLAMRDPVVKAMAFVTCPITYTGRYVPLRYWWIPPINAVSYGVVGILTELLRRKSHSALSAI